MIASLSCFSLLDPVFASLLSHYLLSTTDCRCFFVFDYYFFLTFTFLSLFYWLTLEGYMDALLGIGLDLEWTWTWILIWIGLVLVWIWARNGWMDGSWEESLVLSLYIPCFNIYHIIL
ncbi:hypothetical protein BO70DRAFT_224512 [Aspergillus heteromorphus CBS 117.55]|uniref:NADH dehydrogenase subunit 3 n=1 Tax=Aspergillus heteromorphus CBS 117.55 TaxID=1448321 RepID=A0A317WKM8_9EURO|nr:uncharacterized protein BO70DRAFT_224512 [Aspergillus heteromorphus CBS 117.55]PWY86261.1 hypothetical protein BO70DRAFT_224512 [Aspergillus heteromorphus CBS 117.55]